MKLCAPPLTFLFTLLPFVILTLTVLAAPTQVSVNSSGSGGNATSQRPSLSLDGKNIAFSSAAYNLVTSDSNSVPDIFVSNLETGLVERVSLAGTAEAYGGESTSASISPDGRFVAFVSTKTSLIVPDFNGATADIYLYDRDNDTIQRISLSSGGTQATNASDGKIAISGQGKYVAFGSSASNLVTGDTNGVTDIFLRDIDNQTTKRISTPIAWGTLNNIALIPVTAPNLFPQLLSATYKDTTTGASVEVSATDTFSLLVEFPSGTSLTVLQQAAIIGPSPVFSSITDNSVLQRIPVTAAHFPDREENLYKDSAGIAVALSTVAEENTFELTAEFPSGTSLTAQQQAAIIGSSPGSSPDWSQSQSILGITMAAVTFVEMLHDIYKDPVNNNVSVIAASGDTFELVVEFPSGTSLDATAQSNIISETTVSALDTQLAGSTAGTDYNLGVKVTTTTTTGYATVKINDAKTGFRVPTNISDLYQDLSSYTAGSDYKLAVRARTPSKTGFVPVQIDQSSYTFVVKNIANLKADLGAATRRTDYRLAVQVKKTATTTGLVGVRINDTGDALEVDSTAGSSINPGISYDGRYIVFQSDAKDLVVGDTNDTTDIFLYDDQTSTTTRISSGTMQANSASIKPAINGDGRFTVFTSSASNLVANDTNSVSDIFLYDKQTSQLEAVSLLPDGTLGANDHSLGMASVSDDGRYIAYYSDATNLVDNNDKKGNIFVRDRGDTNLGHSTSTQLVNPASHTLVSADAYPILSGDGRYVGYQSITSTNTYTDVFRDTNPSLVEWAGVLTITSADTSIDPITLKFGESSLASDEFDSGPQLDRPAPPFVDFGNKIGLSAFFINQDYFTNANSFVPHLYNDIRRPSEMGEYVFHVRADESDFTIQWELTSVPQVFQQISLLEGANVIDMRTATNNTYTPVDGTAYEFTISLRQVALITVNQGWNLISIPGVPENGNPAAIASGTADLDTTFYWYNPSSGSYVASTSLQLGQGYFVLFADTTQTEIPISVTHAYQYEIQLLQGWNLIGSVQGNCDFSNPVTFDVTNTTQQSVSSVLASSLFTWDPTTQSFKPAATIEAGKGYWVLAVEDCYLHITTTLASAPAMVAKPARMTIALTLRTKASQKELVLGADPSAKAGLDRYDRPIPPPSPLGESIAAYFSRDEANWSLQSDIQPLKESMEWRLDVKSSSVQLSIDAQDIPEGYLLSAVTSCGAYNLGQLGQLMVSSEEVLLTLKPAQDIPTKTGLLQNYPNPFNPETWIPFELSQDSAVSLTIYNASGQLVRLIDLGQMAAGRYARSDKAIYWDGRSQTGEQVASGTYFYKLDAGEYSETRKMLILK